ncbi:hypothetical protein PIGHUM_03155 [Pigmentiphaga humi]|uniref:DUF2946 domain-containing protein n=2 Tax=Pigmentiphaga humi TaxID=2478468 RepID=A0A3P4B7E0_9BURK|nr:DUF2946 domain-containing protein [Pigmentiphaga humi]VCU71075.1 hypothetical protein PIGHUM_03155 [Pigmentiphaga humi]
MLLLVCAPTVSHFLAATWSVTVPICTEADTPGQSAIVSILKLDKQHDSSHHQADLEDCGYCGLLTHDAALLPVPPAMPFPLLLVMLALLLPPLRRFTPIGAFPSGQPRAPPRFS